MNTEKGADTDIKKFYANISLLFCISNFVVYIIYTSVHNCSCLDSVQLRSFMHQRVLAMQDGLSLFAEAQMKTSQDTYTLLIRTLKTIQIEMWTSIYKISFLYSSTILPLFISINHNHSTLWLVARIKLVQFACLININYVTTAEIHRKLNLCYLKCFILWRWYNDRNVYTVFWKESVCLFWITFMEKEN